MDEYDKICHAKNINIVVFKINDKTIEIFKIKNVSGGNISYYC